MPISLRCTSRIEKVVVYARGAMITRRVEPPSPSAGEAVDLMVAGISPLAEPGAMRAQADGQRLVLGVQPCLVVPKQAVGGGEAHQKFENAKRAYQRIDGKHQELVARREQLLKLKARPALNGRGLRADAAARFGDALAVHQLVDNLARDLETQLAQINHQLEASAKELSAARLELEQAQSLARLAPGHPSWEVTIHLSAGEAIKSVELTYPVLAARWWPAYGARISPGGNTAQLSLEAFVAQASLENWDGVQISLCTADMVSDARLPELASLRIGRAQPAPRKGLRQPPEGLDAMFAAYDQAMGANRDAGRDGDRAKEACQFEEMSAPCIPVAAAAPVASAMEQESICEDYVDLDLCASPVANEPLPAKPEKKRLSRAAAPARSAMASRAPAPSFGARVKPRPEPAAEESIDSWLDFDALTLPAADGPGRGRLQRSPSTNRQYLVDQAVTSIESARPAGQAIDPLQERGEFDDRFDARGLVEVLSNAVPHRVTLQTVSTSMQGRFRTVPRDGAEVYREAVLLNPFASALLGGPIDIFMDGAFVSTSPLAKVGRGGFMTLGLGVEERLRVARNVSAEETSKGLLSATAAINHVIKIEVASALGHDIDLEILDRLPVSDEKEVKIAALESSVAFQPYDQVDRGSPLRGGIRFLLKIPAGKKSNLTYGYRVELPGKMEISGGNRRE